MNCTADGCDRRAISRGLCRKHYSRWWRHGNPNHARHWQRSPAWCQTCGVDREAVSWFCRGLCPSCYGRSRRGTLTYTQTARLEAPVTSTRFLRCEICDGALADHRIGQCRIDLGIWNGVAV